MIKLFNLTTLKLTPIRHLIKEFLRSIVQLNIDIIESMVQGVLVIIIENHVVEMLCLPQTGIAKPPTMHFAKATNLCIQMAPLKAFVQKEGWEVSQLKGKYVAQLSTLIQVTSFKGTREMYVSKKFMLVVALIKLQKLVNQVQVVFNNLHFEL